MKMRNSRAGHGGFVLTNGMFATFIFFILALPATAPYYAVLGAISSIFKQQINDSKTLDMIFGGFMHYGFYPVVILGLYLDYKLGKWAYESLTLWWRG